MKNRYKAAGILSDGCAFISECLANDMLDCAKQYWIREINPTEIKLEEVSASETPDSYVVFTRRVGA